MILSPGQPIPHGRPYRYHLNGPVHMMTAKKRVGPLPNYRLAVRPSADHSSSDSSSEASSDFHSDASSDSSSRHSLSDHSSPDLPSTSAGPSRKRRRSPMTSVPALPFVSEALSPVHADLIPSPKRVTDSGYSADVEAEINECIAYADALRDRGIDARVVVEVVDQDETETGVRGPVEVARDEAITFIPYTFAINFPITVQVLGVLVLSFKGDKVLQEVSTSRFWFKEGYLVVKFDLFEKGFHQMVFFDLFVQGFSVRVLLSSRILSTSFIGGSWKTSKVRSVLGFKKSDYLEYKGAQENYEAEVIQESNNHAKVAQRKFKVKQLEGKTNMDCLVNKQVHHGANVGAVIMKIGVLGQESAEGNAAERYRGDSNMATLGVTTVIKEYAHKSLTFKDAVACEVISKWIFVMKEDMDTLSNYMGFTCESKAEIWVIKGLLDEAKEIILGMEIFRTLGVGSLLRDCDVEKRIGSEEYQVVCTRLNITWPDVDMLDGFNRGLQMDVQVFADSDYTMGRSIKGYELMIHRCAVSWEISRVCVGATRY
ncbi:hypothetical protein Tco_1507307 [Tanacetum coccineum]